jgi:hypothetical protein
MPQRPIKHATITAGDDVPPPVGIETYGHLACEFDDTHMDTRGGVTFDYITGEQCATRLNTVLGPFNWAFNVKEHGYNEPADEIWVLGELMVYGLPNGEGLPYPVSRQQFGSQKIKRARQTGNPLDIGFDLKGATTDAMKKCASLIGVGLYLSSKEPAHGEPAPSTAPAPAAQRPATAAQEPQRPATAQQTGNGATAPTPISKAPSAQPAGPQAPAPGRWINRGQKPVQKGDWEKFYTACNEKLGLDDLAAILSYFEGNVFDIGQLLQAYNTDLQGIYLLLQWLHEDENRAAPPYVEPLVEPPATQPTKATPAQRR